MLNRTDRAEQCTDFELTMKGIEEAKKYPFAKIALFPLQVSALNCNFLKNKMDIKM